MVVALAGLFWGEDAIRDPGQRRENGLVWMYLGGAVVMLVNGWLSHRLTVMHYEEQVGPLKQESKPTTGE